MDKNAIAALIQEVFLTCPGNTVSPEDAIAPELVGMPIYEEPLVGIASAGDPLFEEYKNVGIIGPWYMSPPEWLPGAKTVVSIFFPYTEQVKDGERKADGQETSPHWLHGRIEGQKHLEKMLGEISCRLTEKGVQNCVPYLDPRFRAVRGKAFPEYPEIRTYASNWSERHAAYASGLGTFGLSKGIITEKGMAGRLGSVILDVEIPADVRPYTGIYDYCINCGACVQRCPVQAIDPETGKEHPPCYARLKQTRALYDPRMGCGKCQTAVPCESCNPSKPK